MRWRQRLRRAGVSRADLVGAMLVAALSAVALWGGPRRSAEPVEIALVAVASVALLWRHRWPTAVFVVTAVAAELMLAAQPEHVSAVLLGAPLLALYTLAETGDRRRHLSIAAVVVLILGLVHVVVRPTSLIGAGTLALVAFGALAVAAGEAARNRRAYLAEVEARARTAEADRDAEAARRVTEERLRLARELHDVIGHQLAVIAIQAAVADQTLTSEPAQAQAALRHVRSAGKAALAELRDTIGLLRTPSDVVAPVEPGVGIDGLPDLYAAVARSGVTVSARTEGLAYPLPPSVDLTAYRLVQESLTNVCRHAGPVPVTVTFTYAVGELRISVVNAEPGPAHGPAPEGPAADGPTADGPTLAGSGHGLVGMGERVAALGGSLRYGPTPGGGFRVAGVLPVGPALEVSDADRGAAGR